MEWSQDINLEANNEYQRCEILLNPRHTNYYNKTKKEDAWKEIVEKLNKIKRVGQKNIRNKFRASFGERQCQGIQVRTMLRVWFFK